MKCQNFRKMQIIISNRMRIKFEINDSLKTINNFTGLVMLFYSHIKVCPGPSFKRL